MRISTLLPLVAVWVLTACEKPLPDARAYYPTVITESVTPQPDGSVVAVGRISDQGHTAIVAAGFCVNTNPLPEMLDAQALANVDGDRFRVVYDGFSSTGTYYFRAWATNESGYSYGDVLSLTDIQAQPVVPPCTPPLGQASPGGGLMTQSYYPISAPTESMGDWVFEANTSAHFFDYRFGSALGTGIYTTTTSMSPAPGTVYISFVSGFTSGVLQAGHEVYVNELTPTSWQITICQAPWGSGPYYLTTKFNVPS
jgi:hypothetical protein